MNKEYCEKIIEYFEKRYKNPRPALEYGSNYQLLVAVILSAQCTDERVNKVTKVLFENYPTPEKMITLLLILLFSIFDKNNYFCGDLHLRNDF